MKTRSYIFFFVFSLWIIPTWAQQKIQHDIPQAKINLSLLSTPTYNLQNAQSLTDPSKKWLSIELEYIPIIESRTTSTPIFNFKDRFWIEFELFINDPITEKSFFLTTSVRYWPISFDSKKHYALVLIPPQIIKKITSTRINNVFMNKHIKVQATIYLNDKVIQKTFYPTRRKPSAKFFSEIKNLPDLIKLPGAILSRDKTPWFNISYDKYELIKK